MTSTATIPAHASTLHGWLSRHAPVLLDNDRLACIRRETGLERIDVIAGLDFLATVGLIVRSEEKLRCEVRLRT